ncbi:MAG: hypothetical protein ABR501_12635 [Pyrinomonadaceae bacterium]
MKSMSCRNICKEIEETGPGDLLSTVANNHLKSCHSCEMFRQKHLKLQEIVSSLGTVAAPGDFDFRLRARLASEANGKSRLFTTQKFSLGLRSAAVASVLMMIGAGLLFVALRSSGNVYVSSNGPNHPSSAIAPAANQQDNAPQVRPDVAVHSVPPQTSAPVRVGELHPQVKRGGRGFERSRASAVASMRNPLKLNTRDLSSSTAQVVRPNDERNNQLMEQLPNYAFPIEASYQSLKVSLDDGRGTSRTISLPTVSFGSQRSLSQNSSPLLASSRGSW